MLLLYRIHAILSSVSGIVQFPEYDGLHKYQTFHTFRTSRTFQTFQTTQPPVFSPSSLYSSARKLTMRQRKVDSYRLYCSSRRMKDIHYIYERSELYFPAVQSRISSAQKQAKAQPNRNTTNHTIGSSFGAICSTQPPANALRRHPNAHNTRTITDYLQPIQTPLWGVPAPYRRLPRRPAYTDSGRQQQFQHSRV